MTPQQELETLAIQARQAVSVASALLDRFDALCDPHAGFKVGRPPSARSVHHLHAVVHLLSVVASEAEWEARSEAARLNRLGLGRPFP